MRTLGRILIVVIGVAFIGGIVAGLWPLLPRPEDANTARDESFVIAQGESTKVIAEHLADQGFTAHPWFLRAYAKISGQSGKLKAGEYQLSKNMSVPALVNVLAVGTTRPQLKVRVLEGWSIQEMTAAFAQQGIFDKHTFNEALADADCRHLLEESEGEIARASGQGSLEGYLFPDTYFIFTDDGPCALLEKMVANFSSKYSSALRQETASQQKTIHEVLTLASIVEREVQKTDDRAVVAGIFLKRMEIGMPLQSDATVNYVTGKYASRPSVEDLKVNSPYNTYLVKGLPPGPIGNPGLAAIRAVLYPQRSDYLYFLTAPDGTTVFSRTYDEHLANKAKYLK